jgi:pyruvate kinase
MPGLSVDLPAMSDKDKQDIKWGINNDVSQKLV